MECSDNRPTGSKCSGQVSWSLYRQMISMVQPKKLSCMTNVKDDSNTRSVGVKAKVKEMQQLERDIQTFIASETPMERIKRTFTEK